MRDMPFETLQSGWFGELPPEIQHYLISIGRSEKATSGDTVFDVGAEGRDLYGVIDGSIRLLVASNEHHPRFAHLVCPGSWFGENELVTRSPRLMEAQAAEDSLLLRISAFELERSSRNHPDIWRWIARLSAQQTMLAISAADDLMLRNPQMRIAALLLRLSGQRGCHHDTKPRHRISASQQEISEALNLSLSGTGRLLRQLDREQIIRLHYGNLTIEDNQNLARLLQ